MGKTSEIFDAWKQQAAEYFKKTPDVTEQYAARELTTFMSSKAFDYFEGKFPDLSARIKSAFAGKDWQSRVVVGGLTLLFKNKKFKEMTPPMVATLISDAMSEITRWISSADKTATDGSLYPGLESKLLQLSAGSLESYITWQDSLNDDEFASVCAFLATKSVEEIDALLQLDTDKRNKVMTAFLRLHRRPAAIAGTAAPEKASPFLAALQRMKGGLQLIHDQTVGAGPGTTGQEGS
jgi:hypothetical protein